MIRFTTALAGLLVGATLAPATAQDIIQAVGAPVYAGRYDVATQTFYPSSVDPDLSPSDSSPTVLYDNTTISGSLTTGSGAIATHHFMDWGTPDFGGGGANITEVRIIYATNVLTPASVDMRLRLYTGATGFGTMGTVVGDYLLTGLPNSPGPTGYFAFTVDVTLPVALDIPDGPFGWSYNSDTVATTGLGPMLVGPPNAEGVEDAYDRYLEATDGYVGSFFFGGNPIASFAIRLKGRAATPPVEPFVNYGTGNGTELTGTGSATPGSTDNVLHVHANPPGKSFVLVAGVTEADFFQPNLGLHFYAFPWLVQLAPIATPLLNGNVDLPFALDAGLQPGDTFYVQCFAQNLSNAYKKWSPGLKVIVQ